MENCRLLMCICSNASVAHDIAMMHSMHLLKLLLCIYGGDSPKFMKLPKLLSPIVISSLTRIYRLVKMEKLWKEAFRNLYSCLSPMNIVCLNDM